MKSDKNKNVKFDFVEPPKDDRAFSETIEDINEAGESILDKGKEQFEKIKNDETVQKIVATSKQTFSQAGDLFNKGVQEVMSNETVQKVVLVTKEKARDIIHDEKVEQCVKKIKKGSKHVLDKTYDGLSKILDDKEK